MSASTRSDDHSDDYYFLYMSQEKFVSNPCGGNIHSQTDHHFRGRTVLLTRSKDAAWFTCWSHLLWTERTLPHVFQICDSLNVRDVEFEMIYSTLSLASTTDTRECRAGDDAVMKFKLRFFVLEFAWPKLDHQAVVDEKTNAKKRIKWLTGRKTRHVTDRQIHKEGESIHVAVNGPELKIGFHLRHRGIPICSIVYKVQQKSEKHRRRTASYSHADVEFVRSWISVPLLQSLKRIGRGHLRSSTDDRLAQHRSTMTVAAGTNREIQFAIGNHLLAAHCARNCGSHRL